MGYVYNRATDDMEWTDEGDQPLSPMEQAIQNGNQGDLIRATDEYYGSNGGNPVNIGEHPGTNWYDPQSYQWLINSSTPGAPTPQTPRAPQTPQTPQTAQTSSGGGGGFGGWPQFHAPAVPNIAPFSFESYRAPDQFSYEGFKAPTMEDAQNEPGYAFSMEQGRKALENSAAAKGVLRTGGTLKDILNWGQRSGEQNYGNVYNRATNTYSLNRNNAFENWGANEMARAKAYDMNYTTAAGSYGLNMDRTFGTYDRDLQGRQAEFNPQFRSAELTFADMYNRWRDQLNATTQVATAGMN